MNLDRTSLTFKWWNGDQLPDEVLESCANLFSAHYGHWSDQGLRPGDRIKLTPARLRDFLPAGQSRAVTAWLGDEPNAELLGYAFAALVKDKKHRAITWVTQLVVHTDHQNKGIAKTMLNSIWGFSDQYAWGIASANPFAIRALEKATRHHCDPRYIAKRGHSVMRAVEGIVPYLRGRARVCAVDRSVINTEFHQDHTQIPQKLKKATASTEGREWRLGMIGAGEEWLGITFNSQKVIRWTDGEFRDFMRAAARIAEEAYDRMAISRPDQNHPWARHANAEVDFLISRGMLRDGDKVLDFGCGVGRHAWSLAERGFDVTGVDFSANALRAAREMTSDTSRAPAFQKGDCRDVKLDRLFDAAICLYDVIGSFPDDEDNLRLLTNLSRHLKTGGRVALSVMSYPYTAKIAKTIADVIADSRPLDRLRAGRIMQDTGDVFNPDYFVLDTRKRVVYRKEQFDIGAPLPKEIIIRDRRFDIEEITKMCAKVGIHVEAAGHVSAGRFDLIDQPGEPRKEILVLGHKNSIV